MTLKTTISPKRPAMQAFVDELNRTAVLSEDFSAHLYGLMQAAVAEGFNAGRAQPLPGYVLARRVPLTGFPEDEGRTRLEEVTPGG